MPHISHFDWKVHTHIGLDLDETLASTVSGMLEEAHSQGILIGVKSFEDIHKYSFPHLDTTLTEEIGNLVWETYGKKTMDPSQVPTIIGASEGVERFISLDKQLSIITARSDQEEWKVRRTNDWMRAHFPMITEAQITFVNHFSEEWRPKSSVCKEIGVSLMIDDNMENAIDLAENGITCILLEKPWNRQELFDHPLLYRVKDWQEIIISLNYEG